MNTCDPKLSVQFRRRKGAELVALADKVEKAKARVRGKEVRGEM